MDGNDSLWGGGGDDLLIGGRGADFLYGGPGIDTASYQGSDAGVNVWLGGNSGWGADAQGDKFDSMENVIGTAFSDTITGDAAANLLVGLAGTDILNGDSGNDVLQGGADDDELNGGTDNDTLEGGDGDDQLLGSAGSDILAGGAGADWLQGGAGIDYVDYSSSSAAVVVDLRPRAAEHGGDAEGDVFGDAIEGVVGSNLADYFQTPSGGAVHGGGGNDTLRAFSGTEFWGDAGADTIVFEGSSLVSNPVRIHDFEGAGAAGGDIIEWNVNGYPDWSFDFAGQLNFVPQEGATLANGYNYHYEIFFTHDADSTYIAVDGNDMEYWITTVRIF